MVLTFVKLYGSGFKHCYINKFEFGCTSLKTMISWSCRMKCTLFVHICAFLPTAFLVLEPDNTIKNVWFKTITTERNFKFTEKTLNSITIESSRDKALELYIQQCLVEVLCVSFNIKQVRCNKG